MGFIGTTEVVPFQNCATNAGEDARTTAGLETSATKAAIPG